MPSLESETADPVIILCIPRSYSSVICACLGQHPDLYGFPELNLLACERIGDLVNLDQDTLSRTGIDKAHSAGLLRALTVLDSTIIEGWLERNHGASTHEVFCQLLRLIRPRRGIEKSPSTVLSKGGLERAIGRFPNARFVHLTRHPVTNILSIERHERWRLATGIAAESSGMGLAAFAAHLWSHAHESILRATSQLGDSRVLRVKADHLMLHPREGLARIARWLDLRDDEQSVDSMLRPDRSPYASPGPFGPGLDNDPVFQAHPALRRLQPSPQPQRVELNRIGSWLQDRVWSLSERLGYEPMA